MKKLKIILFYFIFFINGVSARAGDDNVIDGIKQELKNVNSLFMKIFSKELLNV